MLLVWRATMSIEAQNVAAVASAIRQVKREKEVFMGKVILDMSMSVDGFIAGPNDEDGGLHDYFFSPSGDTAQVVEEGIKTTGGSSWAGGVTILETSLTDL